MVHASPQCRPTGSRLIAALLRRSMICKTAGRNAIEPLSALERRKSYWGALHSDVTFDRKSRLSGLVRTPGDRI